MRRLIGTSPYYGYLSIYLSIIFFFFFQMNMSSIIELLMAKGNYGRLTGMSLLTEK